MSASSRPLALVLGAHGRFGSAAVQSFAAAGWDVLAQVRRSPPEPDGGAVRWLRADVADTAALVRAAAGARVVVHALNPAYTDWERQAMPLLESSLRVAQALDARLMMPGNVYNFGADMPEQLAEDTPQRASTRKGRVRIAMEQRLARAADDGQARSIVVRAGEFFGSGTGSWFDRALVKDIRRGRMTYPGALDVPVSWAYVPDLAESFARLAAREISGAAAPADCETVHFHGHRLSGADWVRLFEVTARRERWLGEHDEFAVAGLPWRLIRLGAPLVPIWRELAEMQYLWQTPHALSGHRLAALIGPEPRTPLVHATCRSLQSLGHLGAAACAGLAWA